MQQEEWILALPTYIMGAVHHEMGIRSSQLTFWRRTFFQILAHPVFQM